MEKPEFMRECLWKYLNSVDYFSWRPDLDLEFYLGALLYSSEMKKNIDCFFDSEKADNLKWWKELRVKVSKVHDTLYKYSHEKLKKFVEVKELAYIMEYFFQLNESSTTTLQDSMRSIRSKCLHTLN